jgi:hypothetical protein
LLSSSLYSLGATPTSFFRFSFSSCTFIAIVDYQSRYITINRKS